MFSKYLFGFIVSLIAKMIYKISAMIDKVNCPFYLCFSVVFVKYIINSTLVLLIFNDMGRVFLFAFVHF